MTVTGQHTCPSIYEHGNRVLDVTVHYFACLKDSERSTYFDRLPEQSQHRIINEQRRARKVAKYFEDNPTTEGGHLQKRFRKSLHGWRGHYGRPQQESKRGKDSVDRSDNEVESDIQAPLIYFKNSRPYDIPGCSDQFPNQKVPLKHLLIDDFETNPLMQPCDDNMIRYFHLPANNMKWVEVCLYFLITCII
jgi:hypothetical protein